MLEHSLDLPLSIVVFLLLVDKGVALFKWTVARINGTAHAIKDNPGHVTREEFGRFCDEVNAFKSDQRRENEKQHTRITDVAKDLAHLSGRLEGGR